MNLFLLTSFKYTACFLIYASDNKFFCLFKFNLYF